MSIYQTAVKRPVTTILIFLGIAIFGLFSLSRLSIDLLPDIETNAIMVMTSYGGASAEDIETNITRPLENTLNSVTDLKHVTSKSREGISVITLEFEYGTDIDVATNDVRDKLDRVTTLPDGANTPILFKFGTDDIPILLLSVTAKESFSGLYKILDDQVATPLARVQGVGTVSISGLPEREIQIYCDPLKLEAYGISIETIGSIIGAENKNIPAGSIDIGSNVYSMRVQKEFEDANEMLDLVVGMSGGVPVYLRDVARIVDAPEERAQESFTDGVQGGILVIQKQSGANSVNISRAVVKKLEDIKKTLPSDIVISPIIDTSDNIIKTIDSLTRTIATTLIIVSLVVLLFLGRWRATFVIVLTIPISLLSALTYLLATGNTLNIISMSALSIAIGMVVDNAIVVLENITTHIERGSRPRQAAMFATNEVAISVMASTLTTIAVFLPLTMVQGIAGIMFEQLGWMVTIILAVSTIGAITLTPTLCSLMLRLSHKQNLFQKVVFNPFNGFLKKLTAGYARLLHWCVRHRKTTVFIALALFFGSIFVLLPFVKTEFFPSQDNARIGITIKLPTGTRQNITRDLGFRIVDQFKQNYPEIEKINFTEGQAGEDNVFGNMSDNGNNILSFNISTSSSSQRERSLTEICDLMRIDLEGYPEIKTYNVQAGGGGGGIGGESAVEIELYGYSFDKGDVLAAEVAQKMKSYNSVSQVVISRDEYTPEYRVDFDREKLALNGLNMSTAAGYLRNRINGYVPSYFREDGEEYDIRIRYDKDYRQSIQDIENITIYNATGQGVKIRDLGTVVESQSPPTIERKDRERVITVKCVVAHGYAMSDVISAANEAMADVEMPTGFTWQFGGTFENQSETFTDMALLFILIIILVFIIMASQFESLTYPFVIMFSIPFAITGVLIGLYITQTPLSVMALLGVLMLVGIVVNNGIVLIDYIMLCRERGMGLMHSVVTSGKSRLRPILMTTLTTVFGMIPMAVSTGEGSEMWRSMGMTVAFGLSFSTLITLIIIPTLYSSFAANGIRRARKKELKSLKK